MDVSGIPNMGFGGGAYFGGNAATGQPAFSANDINASMGWNPNAAQFNPWANTPGGFGAQTAAYANLGAAFGRGTGGFGGLGAANADPFSAVRSGYPSGQVTRGADLPQPSIGGYNPVDPSTWTPQGWGPQTDRNALADMMSRNAPSSGVVGGWYNPFGGGGGYPMPAAPTPRAPVQSQDWQSTFNNMTAGNSSNPYALGDSSWYPSSRGGGGYNAADPSTWSQQGWGSSPGLDLLRAGRGWTIAEQPQAASQGSLASRINQSIYDVGNAGDYYSRLIGGGFGGRGGSGHTLTPQDMSIPHAYPPEVRVPYQNPFGDNQSGAGG